MICTRRPGTEHPVNFNEIPKVVLEIKCGHYLRQ